MCLGGCRIGGAEGGEVICVALAYLGKENYTGFIMTLGSFHIIFHFLPYESGWTNTVCSICTTNSTTGKPISFMTLQFPIYSMTAKSSAIENLASVFLSISLISTPGASSVKVSPPLARSTWKTH